MRRNFFATFPQVIGTSLLLAMGCGSSHTTGEIDMTTGARDLSGIADALQSPTDLATRDLATNDLATSDLSTGDLSTGDFAPAIDMNTNGCSVSGTPYGGGAGTMNSPYLICSALQMNTIGTRTADFAAYFQLATDIDLSVYTGTQFNMIGTMANPFTGVFDGNNHTIANFTYIDPNTETDDTTGLFAQALDATLENITMTNVNVQKVNGPVGALVGNMDGGNLQNITVSGALLGDQYVGLIAGNAYAQNSPTAVHSDHLSASGTVGQLSSGGSAGQVMGGIAGTLDGASNLTSAVTLTGSFGLGGISGFTGTGDFTMGTATGDVNCGGGGGYCGGAFGDPGGIGSITHITASGNVTGGFDVGGFAGETGNITIISNCSASGNVTAGEWGGGFIGEDEGVMAYDTDSATGDVTCSSSICGGFWGSSGGGTANNVSATGDVTGMGDDVGGLSGSGTPALTSCYATGNVSGASHVGGIVGIASANITNSYASGNVTGTGDNVGGISGWGSTTGGPSVSGCYVGALMQISGVNNVGGLVGLAGSGSVLASSVPMGVTITGTGNDVGGIVGQAGDGNITGCHSGANVTGVNNVGGVIGITADGGAGSNYATGTVTGNTSVGGLIGNVASGGGAGSNNYAWGAVTGNDSVGGLVGTFDCSNSIVTSYSTGAVTGVTHVGGLVGNSMADGLGTSTDSFWDTQTSGQATSAGSYDTGASTAQLKSQNFYPSSWDFTATWQIVSGGFPTLR